MCDLQLAAVQFACKCENFALQSVFAMDLQCAIKVQQQRAQLKILFEGSFATFPPPTRASMPPSCNRRRSTILETMNISLQL